MKKLLLIALTVLALFGCETELKTTAEETQMCSISFALAFEEEIISFPSTKAIPSDPNGLVGEPVVSNTGETENDPSGESGEGDGNNNTNSSELFNKIEYVVYKVNDDNITTFVSHDTYSKKDGEGWIIIEDELSPAEYIFYFFCHSTGSGAEFNKEDVTLSFNEVSDSFYKAISVTLNNDTKSQRVDLERVVSRIEVLSTDKLLNSYKQFIVSPNRLSNKFNLVSGKACDYSDNYSFSRIYDLTEDEYKNADLAFSFYTFVPETEKNIDITTILYGGEADDKGMYSEEIKKIEINDIEPKTNYIVRYKGSFFDPTTINNSFSLNVISNWAEKEFEIDSNGNVQNKNESNS